MTKEFDPFSDRTARDIRNALSSALVAQLQGGQDEAVASVARQWLMQAMDPIYRAYIHGCQEKYAEVVDLVKAASITDTRMQAVVLWNAELFFEMHELLETIWHDTVGDERIALKGLIQAAGVFLHRRRRHDKAADTLAQRARRNLSGVKAHLRFIGNLGQLMESLEDAELPPPKLSPREP